MQEKKAVYQSVVAKYNKSRNSSINRTYSQYYAKLSLLIHIIIADKKISKEEYNELLELRKQLMNVLDENSFHNMLNDIVKNGKIYSIEKIAEEFPAMSDRISLYELSYAICMSDHNVHRLEKKLLKHIAHTFELSEDILEEIHKSLNPEHKNERKSEHQHK